MQWITQGQIARWAQSQAARLALPELIADLIRASARNISDFRFPNGDAGQLRGFDGWLVAEGMPPWVPDGESVWEFGASGAQKAKLDQDYKDKTAAITDATWRQDRTLVLVTPFNWDNPKLTVAQWLSAKRALGEWKQVDLIEGNQLADWIDENPAVAARWAKRLGFQPEKVQSTDDFWDEYGLRFERPLTEEVVLCGREKQATDLVASLLKDSGAISLTADSPDEVVAFAVAAIRKAAAKDRFFLEARTLVIDTDDAARALYQGKNNGIFLPRGSAEAAVHLLAPLGPTLKTVSHERPSQQGNILPHPAFHDLAKALETTGLEPDRAMRVARECGRSITILARTFPGQGLYDLPKWRDEGDKLLPALLAGAWDVERAADKRALSDLAGGRAFETIEQDLRPFLKRDDPPIDREGGVWKMRAPVDAFVHIAHRLGRDDLERFRKVAIDVLSYVEPDPKPNDYLRVQKGSDPTHSEWVRDGIATTILQIAVLSEAAGLDLGGQLPQAWVDDLVAALPLDRDHRLFASLRGQLPYLMEAAPVPLLAALERLLEGDQLAPIFDEIEGPLSPFSRHTGLLWALETLAWDPAFLLRVCDILARLAVIDPKGRLTNRPDASLREILLPWSPNTYASDEDRLLAIEVVLKRNADVGYRLALSLLPRDHDFSTPTTKPRFREAGQGASHVPTHNSLVDFYTRLARRVIELANGDRERLVALASHLERFGGEPWVGALAAFKGYLSRAAAADRAPVWSALREIRDRHRKFATAQWAMQADQLAQLTAVIEEYAPAVEDNDWGDLFDDWFPTIDDGADDPSDEAILAARRAAVAKVLQLTDPLDRLIELASRSKLPWSVGQPAAQEIDDFEEVCDLLRRALRDPTPERLEFASAVSTEARTRFPDTWPDRIRDFVTAEQVDAVSAARLVMPWPETTAVWDLVAALGTEVERAYWTQKRAWRLKGTTTELKRAIGQYVTYGRPGAALDAVLDRLDELSDAEVLDLVDRQTEILLSSDPGEAFDTMARYRLELIFIHLDNSSSITDEDMAKREYPILPLLQHGKRPLRLHKLMADSGGFYASVLAEVFPSTPSTDDNRERRKVRAEAAYRLLSEFTLMPAARADGSIDQPALEAWIKAVRDANADPERASLYDVYIGQALAHSPADPDGGWPHATVRTVLQGLAAPDIERGIAVERFNMRGVFMKSLFEGGSQERDLATTYRKWGALAAGTPRVAAMLETIAKRWDISAEDSDVRARQDMMRD